MQYGFIGSGNIAKAIIRGALRSEAYTGDQIRVFDANATAQEQFMKTLGVTGAPSLVELTGLSDTVFVAVKPDVYPIVMPMLRQALEKKNSRTIVVSIGAGQSVESVEKALGGSCPVVRVMPNLNAEIGEGVTALTGGTDVTAEEKKAVMDFFASAGIVVELEEKLFPVFTAISSCAPAFAYLFIDSLAMGAVKNGMNKKQALQIAAQTVLGSAKALMESGEHPRAMIDRVCSPGGLTIEGICELEDARFAGGVIHAIDAAVKKDMGRILKEKQGD